VITPGYFAAMGTRLLAGRAFAAADIEEAREVAVVDRLLAERLWPGESPVGHRLGIDLFGQQHWLEVVGEVEHVRHDDLTQDGRPTIYFPHHLFPWPPLAVVVRGAGDPGTLAAPVRGAVRELDAALPVYKVRPMGDYVADAMAARSFAMVLIAVFAGIAVALALVGLFGVISYAVRQRTREIGIRIALGAQRGSILRLVVGRGLLLVGAGIGFGLTAALALTRTLAGLLYGVTPTDPLTFTAISLLLAGVALVASYLPARRASAVDPMVSLRRE
jgi:putative ABC transport system permease protein